MSRKAFLAPNLAIACSALIGGADRIDQIKISHGRLRRERKLSLIFFLFRLGLRAHNAFCFREMMTKGKSQNKISVREFKRRIFLSYLNGKKPHSKELETAKKEFKCNSKNDLLLSFVCGKNGKKLSRRRVWCRENDKGKQTGHGCYSCKLAFCPTFFTKCHDENVLNDKDKETRRKVVTKKMTRLGTKAFDTSGMTI